MFKQASRRHPSLELKRPSPIITKNLQAGRFQIFKLRNRIFSEAQIVGLQYCNSILSLYTYTSNAHNDVALYPSHTLSLPLAL